MNSKHKMHTMELDPVINEMFDILAEIPPKGARLQELRDFRRVAAAKARLIAAQLPKAHRDELINHIHAYIRATNPPEAVRQIFMECHGTLESDLDNVLVQAQAQVRTARKLPFELHEGYSASPTALVRTAFFTNPEPGTQIFKVLGMSNVHVERGQFPMNATHLMVMVYLVSLVREWDEKLGANLVFNAWDALRTMGWSTNKLSLQRLKDAIDCLAGTTVRVYLDFETDRQEAAPMVARRVTEMSKGKYSAWEVQLTSTLLNLLSEYHTFLNFETLAALPSGCTTWLYVFIASEKNKESEWDLDDLARLAGLASPNPYTIKSKLKAALETLVRGSVEVKARGAAVRNIEGRGELVDNANGELVVRSTTSTTKTFSPPLGAFCFRKTQKGKERVKLIKR
jgi:hypothetical protein